MPQAQRIRRVFLLPKPGGDLGEKLQGCKSIARLDYFLHIEQAQPFVTLFERISGTHRWKSTDYDHEEQRLEMGEVRFRVGDLYVQV